MGWIKTGFAARALLTAGAIWASAPVPSWAENLADALAGAYTSSGLLEQNRALLRVADEGVAQAVSRLRPIIDYSLTLDRSLSQTTINGAQIAPRNSTAMTLSTALELLLWDNGATKLDIQSAKESVLATRAQLLSLEQQVLERAVIAYMNVLSSREFLSLRQNNVRLLVQELRAAQDRFDVGEVTRTDVALAESRLAEARSNVASSQGDLITAEEEYLVAVGRKPGKLQPPPPLPARPGSVAAGKSVALRLHPDVVRAQHQVSALELSQMALRSALGPRVTLNGSLARTQSRGDTFGTDSSTLGVTLSQRIYQGGARSANLRSAIQNTDAAKANLLVVQENIAQGVAGAMVRFEVAQASIRASDERIRFAEIAFEGAREEATLGARTTLDVLDAEQDLLDARVSRLAANTNLYVAAYQILSSQGLLTAENLRLRVPIYDPSAYYNQVKDAPALYSKQGRQLDKVLRSLGKD